MNKMYCIETSKGALLVKSAEEAFEHAAAMQRDGANPRLHTIPAEIYLKLVCEQQAEEQQVKIEPQTIAAAKTPPKETAKQRHAQTVSKKQQVIVFMQKISKNSALTMDQICKKTGLGSASVSPILTTLHKEGIIFKTGDKIPYGYYGKKDEIKTEEQSLILCAARGKQITRAACNPNHEHQACKECSHGQKAA